ncbi:hypothetical protein TRFO_04113 [Tritrichomonas foetus]|uniref:Uncharacterized protein n=1 Tax=Tritrichomonas foetus TaxID=1144522 RepID=A0A1J4KHV7_9EUKA|nr:hypothetical protein TRFO_04113 [Tritrichomonas foetus]|eukprot:OHT10626.1 hypothetical protein TRFO_04113 [Tritrichomonas foetus]
MDKFIAEPPTLYSSSDFEFLPYLNAYNREVYYRTDTQTLKDKLQSRRSRSNYNPHSPIIIHQPFSESEHNSVLEYLFITKFFNRNSPIHALPYQLMSSMHNINDRKGTLPRSAESIIQYLTEIYIRRSTLYNAEDNPIVFTSKSFDFPKKKDKHSFALQPPIAEIGMFSKTSKVLKIQSILPAVIAIFISDVSPIVIDLSVSCNVSKPSFTTSFLMSGTSRFTISGNPEFCSDMHRFCCFYEDGILNFIDLTHRVRFKNNDTTIHSFKCWPYPCFETLTMLCACIDPLPSNSSKNSNNQISDQSESRSSNQNNNQNSENHKGFRGYENMIIAASTNVGSISAWEFHGSDHTVSRFSYDLKPMKLEWISGRRLVVVTEEQDITILPFPWDVEDFEPEKFTMDVSHRFVECQGDAYVLEEIHHIQSELDSSTFTANDQNLFNTNSLDISTPSYISNSGFNSHSGFNGYENSFMGSFGKNGLNKNRSMNGLGKLSSQEIEKLTIYGKHKVKVITHNEGTFELEVDFPIYSCAYTNGAFAMSNCKGEIFIWDHKVRHTRTMIPESNPITSIVPVDLWRNAKPMFARVSNTETRFFDAYGKISVETTVAEPSKGENSKVDPFFHKNGYCVTIDDQFKVSVTWFGY